MTSVWVCNDSGSTDETCFSTFLKFKASGSFKIMAGLGWKSVSQIVLAKYGGSTCSFCCIYESVFCFFYRLLGYGAPRQRRSDEGNLKSMS